MISTSSDRHLLAPLSSYAIDANTGFVPACDPLQRLPSAFDPWEEIALDLSGLIRSRNIRDRLAKFPVIDCSKLSSRLEQERAMLLLSVFANAWVWGGEAPDLVIPAPVAMPLCTVAAALDRPPIVHYATMALYNWRRLDPTRPVASDNARMLVQFLGGVDEDWFFMGSLGVELAGAPLLPLIHAATLASHDDTDTELAHLVEYIAGGMPPVLAALERLREWCDPYVYYHRVRPYLSGWPEPGAVYEGVSDSPRRYMGGSAGQSSLLQAIDALLGINHGGAVTGTYLLALREYMPLGHRRFVENVERHTRLRARVETGTPALRKAYNATISEVDLFRRRHIDLARDYIAVPSGMAAGGKGTGGTSFVDFLRDVQQETAETKV